MGAVGIAILMLEYCYLLVQVVYDLFEGAVSTVLGTIEGELTDGGYFPGFAKFLVASTSFVDLLMFKGPAQCLGVDGATGAQDSSGPEARQRSDPEARYAHQPMRAKVAPA